ncbi:MAG: SpoIIE family protein phosphatase, partial [Planctomycetota bacterium]|nr:SpoIIE family protein phosphatase [Planctomycetota bacterium]
GLVTQRTVKAMAQALATCPFARHGGLLDRAELARRIRGVETPARERVASGPLEYRDSGRAPSSAEIAYRQQDLEKARDVQTNMFSRLPTIPGYEFGVHYSAQQQVSGDFYDVITLDDERCLMVVGDVTGHGMQAALVATSALKALRIMVKQGLGHDLRKLLGELNENVKTDLLPGQFITLFAAVFDHQSDSGTAVLAGHHPAIIARGGDEPSLRSIGAKGAAIGILPSATLMRVLSPVEFELASDEVLVQFTDGVVEAPGKGGEEFGMHRLVAEVFRHINEEMRVMADGIAAASVAHEGGSTADDVTVFALRRR